MKSKKKKKNEKKNMYLVIDNIISATKTRGKTETVSYFQ